MARFVAVLALGGVLTATGVGAQAAQHPAPPVLMPAAAVWCLKPAEADPVVFHGVEEADPHAVNQPSILYTAPNAAGILVEIALHGAIVGGMRDHKRQAAIAAADKMLEPYRPVLDGFRSKELYDRVLDARAPDGASSLACSTPVSASAWVVETTSGFAMTQDQTTLIVESAFVMHPPGSPKATPGTYVVRVIGTPFNVADPQEMWTEEDGRKLKEESVALLGEAMAIALRLAAGEVVPADAPYKTYRYVEGGLELMQRVQVASESCERALLKTLRGDMWSVPRKPTDCMTDARSNPAPAESGPHP
jgi:hypothetical protein